MCLWNFDAEKNVSIQNDNIFNLVILWHITKTRLFKYTENFTTKK